MQMVHYYNGDMEMSFLCKFMKSYAKYIETNWKSNKEELHLLKWAEEGIVNVWNNKQDTWYRTQLSVQ